MASRSVWKGFIRFSLVSVPVKAYTAAASGGGGISLNQLHKECNTRVQYKKVCPTHGELTSDQIVSGYEFSKGQYVVIDTDELEKLRSESDRAISIGAFVKTGAIDPRYLTGKNHYLLPDGPVGMRSYAVMHRAMAETDRCAFAQVVMHGKEQIVLLRPMPEGMFVMSQLAYESEVKKPAEFTDEVPRTEIDPNELKLARTLMDSLADDEFDLSAYADKYTANLIKLIEAKIAGKEIVAPANEEAPQVINLMEALERSLAEAKAKKARSGGKPAKLVAPSTAGAAKARKRKTS